MLRSARTSVAYFRARRRRASARTRCAGSGFSLDLSVEVHEALPEQFQRACSIDCHAWRERVENQSVRKSRPKPFDGGVEGDTPAPFEAGFHRCARVSSPAVSSLLFVGCGQESMNVK